MGDLIEPVSVTPRRPRPAARTDGPLRAKRVLVVQWYAHIPRWPGAPLFSFAGFIAASYARLHYGVAARVHLQLAAPKTNPNALRPGAEVIATPFPGFVEPGPY